jgi:hypothetical protein
MVSKMDKPSIRDVSASISDAAIAASTGYKIADIEKVRRNSKSKATSPVGFSKQAPIDDMYQRNHREKMTAGSQMLLARIEYMRSKQE